jgi:hypothetical protein
MRRDLIHEFADGEEELTRAHCSSPGPPIVVRLLFLPPAIVLTIVLAIVALSTVRAIELAAQQQHQPIGPLEQTLQHLESIAGTIEPAHSFSECANPFDG